MEYISKSLFNAGTYCHRKLWQLLWDRNSSAPVSDMEKLIFDSGNKFGVLAHKLFPGAKLIDINAERLDEAVRDTKEAIALGCKVILEAAFEYERCRVLSDVVELLDDGSWHLIEVKSSTRDKPEHYIDLAYQKYVMENSGCMVSKCSVIHANKNGIWPDEISIFSTVDVTEKVNSEFLSIESKLKPMLSIEEKNPPDLVASYSKACHQCAYKKTVCWSDINETTIYDVIHASKIPSLKKAGILYLNEIPDDFKLSASDRRNIDIINGKELVINKDEILKAIDKLEYPIYFLDFETLSTPIPLFDGIRPWEKLVFQYSLHVQYEKDGDIFHKEYLHQEFNEPSKDVAEQLVKDIGKTGSVVVYHESMEIGVIKYLAKRFPHIANELNSIVSRVWDLEKIFLKDYRDWRFGTKSSLKVVLPTLCPELSYDELEISDGGGASLGWVEMLSMPDGDEKNKKARELLEYCELDTEAMVKLLEFVERSIR